MATAWDFENGLEGVTATGAGADNLARDGALTTSTTRAYHGSFAAAAHVTVSGNRSRFWIQLPMCPDGVEARNRTLSLWIFLAVETAGWQQTGYGCLPVIDSTTGFLSPDFPPYDMMPGQWSEAKLTVPGTAGAVTYLGLDCFLPVTSSAWSGTVYVDNITFN